MATKRTRGSLERLGIDMNSSDIQVFQAVLKAAGGTGKTVNYHDIVSSLESITGKRYTKAYIYRRLSSLEENGFITVDTIQTPRTFVVTESSLVKSLDALREEKLSENLTKRQELITQINRLKAADDQDLAIVLHEQLSDMSPINNSLIIEGVENVRSTVIREFADGTKKGDIVRVLAHSFTLEDGLEPGGVAEMRVLQAGFRGAKVLGLLTPSTRDKLSIDRMAGHLKPLAEIFKQVAESGNIQLKLSIKPVNTYRLVSLNEDKMLLYLTHAKESDVAALVHRKDNPGLIDDAIRTFDELWESGIDVLNMVSEML